MKRASKIAVGIGAALALALSAAVVNAHPYGYGPGAGMGPGGGMGWGMGGGMGGYGMGPRASANVNPASIMEGRLAFLKSELKITSAQEAAWQAYAAKAKQQAEAMQAWHNTRFNTQPPASAPDRIAQHNEFMKQRVAQMDGMTTALKDLYAALTPEQKAIADQQLGGYGPGAGAGYRGGPGGRFR